VDVVAQLAESMMLGSVLDQVRSRWGGYRLLDHWQQGAWSLNYWLKKPCAGAASEALAQTFRLRTLPLSWNVPKPR
jgi:hypothetical protein